MISRIIILLGIIFSLSGCFYIGSSTIIKIGGLGNSEYEFIKQDIRNTIKELNLTFDCDSDNETWGPNREKGELICNNSSLYVEMQDGYVNIAYIGSGSFWIPTKEIITNEHKRMQKIFLELAKKYKIKYKDVSLYFYHDSLPKEGRKLL